MLSVFHRNSWDNGMGNANRPGATYYIDPSSRSPVELGYTKEHSTFSASTESARVNGMV